jgi:hypothetical protein
MRLSYFHTNREQCRQIISHFLFRREAALIRDEVLTTLAESFSFFPEFCCIEIDRDLILLYSHQLSIYNLFITILAVILVLQSTKDL